MSTLNENILKVKGTLNEIATAIKEQGVSIDECTSPESYGEKIKSIGENIELDADKIHTKAYDVGDLDPRVEVSNTEDGKILFTFGLKRGPQGPAGPAGPSGVPGPAGLNGIPGRDASQIECIYKPVPTEETTIETPNNSQEDNYIPKLEGWFGEPQGVTNVFQVEYCCIRKKIDGIWGDWSKPSICARWGKDGEPGRGIASIEKLFAVNNDPNSYPTENWTTIENVSTSSTNRYMWCQETTTFTSGDPAVIHYIVAVEGEPGVNGTGNDGPIIYPAGVWDDEKEYIAEHDKVPYVFYTVDEKYYMLNSKHLIIGEGEGSIWKGVGYAPGKTYEDEPIWVPIDSFEAIYSDIGLFNQALVGKWVFHGDYMFSQEGVLGTYNDSELIIPAISILSGDSCNYEQILHSSLQLRTGGYDETLTKMSLCDRIKNKVWIPKIWFNAKTGECKLGDAVTIDNDGISTILKNPVLKKKSVTCGTTFNEFLENTDYVINSNPDYHECSQWIRFAGEESEEYPTQHFPISVEKDITVKFTNDSDVIVSIIFEGIWDWDLLYNNEMEPTKPIWRIGVPTIQDGISNYYRNTETLIIYPKTSITLDIRANVGKTVGDIIPTTPVWATKWGGDIVACNIPAIIPYSKMLHEGSCYPIEPNTDPITIISDCNFDYMKFLDTLQGEDVLIKIYDFDLQYLGNVIISDTTDWVKVPVPKGGTIALYYKNVQWPDECSFMNLLFATTREFAGGQFLQAYKSKNTSQSEFKISSITCEGHKKWYNVDINCPDGLYKIEFVPQNNVNDKLFRKIRMVAVDPEQDTDPDENRSYVDATFKRDNGTYKNVDSGSTTLNVSDSSTVGCKNYSFQLRLDPDYIMTGVNKDRVFKIKMTGYKTNNTTVVKYLTLTLNMQSWSSADKHIELSDS